MARCINFCLLLGLACTVSSKVIPTKSGNFTITRDVILDLSGSEQLDEEGKFVIQWNINEEEKTIHFVVTAETTGYVGFGFSPNGGMDGADIFIAGLDPDGNSYSSDRHGTGTVEPVLDEQQDYTLDDAEETDTHTIIKFHRLLDTCDDDDFKVSDATMKLIYAMGTTDDLEYHTPARRGTKSVNFYLSDDDTDLDKYQKIDFTNERELPAEHTTYWCTIHEVEQFDVKQHIVAFEPILDNPDALQHTHHFIFYRCHAPEGVDPNAFFQQWTVPNHKGDYCYDSQIENFPFSQYCNGNQVFVWSKGGKRMVFPPDLGLPMPDILGQKEYYAMEVHYDNPDKLAGKTFSTGGRMYYTNELRPIDAGLMVVDHRTSIQLTIPPMSPEYVVSGHCSGECTQLMLPENGITAFNNLLHAHLTGRKIKLRHFRGDDELEWIDNDQYYDFDFQQNKPLQKPREIKRGDHLTVECTFDTTKVKDGKAVIGGLSSQEEMCQAWFFYYPRMPEFSRCGSRMGLEKHMNLLGFSEWEEAPSNFPGGAKGYKITKPDNMAGEYLESVSSKIDWSDAFRQSFQQEKRYGLQEQTCRGGVGEVKLLDVADVKYPEIVKEYEPVDECQAVTGETGTESTVTDSSGTESTVTQNTVTESIGTQSTASESSGTETTSKGTAGTEGTGTETTTKSSAETQVVAKLLFFVALISIFVQ